MSNALSILQSAFDEATEGEASTTKAMAQGMTKRPVATLAQRAIDRGSDIEEHSKTKERGSSARKERLELGSRIRRFGERLARNRNLQLAFDQTADSPETLTELLDSFSEDRRSSLIRAWLGGTDGATSATDLLTNYLDAAPRGQQRTYVASAMAVASRAAQADDARVKQPGKFIEDSSIVPVGSMEEGAGVIAPLDTDKTTGIGGQAATDDERTGEGTGAGGAAGSTDQPTE